MRLACPCVFSIAISLYERELAGSPTGGAIFTLPNFSASAARPRRTRRTICLSGRFRPRMPSFIQKMGLRPVRQWPTTLPPLVTSHAQRVQATRLLSPSHSRARPASSPPARRRPTTAFDPTREVDEYFHQMERQIEDAFDQSSSSGEIPPAPLSARLPKLQPLPSAQEPGRHERRGQRKDQRRSRSVGCRRRDSESGSVGSAAVAPAHVAAGARPKQAQPLAKLLDRVAPPAGAAPKPKAVRTSPSRLSESGEAEGRLRADISANMRRVVDVFRELDSDGSGEIDASEFRKGMRLTLSGSYTDDELDEVFRSIDSGGDGHISYRELQRALRLTAAPAAAHATGGSSLSFKGSSTARDLAPSQPPQSQEEPSTSTAASPAAAPDAASATVAAATGAAARVHPLRKKEVLRLFHEFCSQHAAGVCKIDRFDRLLRLQYPTDDRASITAMLAVVRSQKDAEARRAEAIVRVQRDIETVFDALDIDHHVRGHGLIRHDPRAAHPPPRPPPALPRTVPWPAADSYLARALLAFHSESIPFHSTGHDLPRRVSAAAAGRRRATQRRGAFRNFRAQGCRWQWRVGSTRGTRPTPSHPRARPTSEHLSERASL